MQVESRRKPTTAGEKTEEERLSDHSLGVLPSCVSQPLGLTDVPVGRVAGDAFNTATSDDTDPARQ